MTNLRTLQKIYALFGPRTVLLPIHPGTKKCFREEWQNTTWETTQQARYQTELANGGIAVLFGPENLAGLDCDTEERVAEFLELNPWAADTLQTRGARGRTFHFRLNGNYPRVLCKLKTVDDAKIGEWRGANGYTVVSGIHPDTGEPYQILVEKEPLIIEWVQIKWPPHWGAPWESQARYTFGTGNGDHFSRDEQTDLERRILAYLAGCPPAISGNGGHIQTLKVATQLVVSFALGVDGAMPYLQEYNKKCEPPWSEKELLHKAREAEKNKLGREPGAKIRDETANTHKSDGEGADTEQPRIMIEFLRPSQVLAYDPPPGIVLAGDNHIVRDAVFVLAGAPGVGKPLDRVVGTLRRSRGPLDGLQRPCSIPHANHPKRERAVSAQA